MNALVQVGGPLIYNGRDPRKAQNSPMKQRKTPSKQDIQHIGGRTWDPHLALTNAIQNEFTDRWGIEIKQGG